MAQFAGALHNTAACGLCGHPRLRHFAGDHPGCAHVAIATVNNGSGDHHDTVRCACTGFRTR